LTDPEYLDKKIVWCIGVSAVIPENKNSAYLEHFSLNDIKRTNLDIFVDGLNKVLLQ
jgi:hypothetical protein